MQRIGPLGLRRCLFGLQQSDFSIPFFAGGFAGLLHCAPEAEKPGAVFVQPCVLLLGGDEILSGDDGAHHHQLHRGHFDGQIQTQRKDAQGGAGLLGGGQPFHAAVL
jgi:hypothetical protein